MRKTKETRTSVKESSMNKFVKVCAALAVSFGPLASTITEVNARPSNLGQNVIVLDAGTLDRITAGRLATEAEIETWVLKYVGYRKSQGKVSDWERTLTKDNVGKRVSVVQGGKNATGPREARLGGGNCIAADVW